MDAAVLYVVGIGLGVVSGLFGTASDAALKSVVTSAQLPQAVSANQGRDGAVSLVASPISGALMAVSNALPFAVAAGAALIQVVATRVIRADLRPIDDEEDGAGGHPDDEGDGRPRWPRLDEYLAGFRFIVGQDVLCRLILGTVGINCRLTALFVGLQLVLKEDGVQTWRIGLLDSFMAVGMIVGAVIAQGLLKRVRTGTLIIGLFLAGCAALVPIALVQDIRVSLAALTVVGLVMPALNGAMMGYAQALIPGRLQGRVLSAAGLLGQTLPALMPVLMGVGLSTIGPPASMGATVGLFALSAVLVTSHRGIRALGRPGEWSADEGATTAPSGGDPAPVVPDAGLD